MYLNNTCLIFCVPKVEECTEELHSFYEMYLGDTFDGNRCPDWDSSWYVTSSVLNRKEVRRNLLRPNML